MMRGNKFAEEHFNEQRQGKVFLLIAVLLIAINLRPALATVGPLIAEIRADTGLSNSLLGLLTTLPLLAFGIVSIFTSLVTGKFGIGYTLPGAMAVLAIGLGIRSAPGNFYLYFGTVLIGVGIAFGNVLLPGITKQKFSERSGAVTSLYSGILAVGASVAAGVSVPLSQNAGLGWRLTLCIWGVLAVIAFLGWLPQVKYFKGFSRNGDFLASTLALAKKSLAWKIAIFMGLQSMTFYIILTWLPEILQHRGATAEYAGWMLSLSQATGILGSLVLPLWAARKENQQSIMLWLFVMELIAVVALIFPHLGFEAVWVSLIGFVLGGSFGLALLLIVLRAKDIKTTTELSGMAQSIGYLIAATGPIIFGNLFDLTGTWTIPLTLLVLIAVVKFYCGFGAAREGKV